MNEINIYFDTLFIFKTRHSPAAAVDVDGNQDNEISRAG